ncbi:hypothetical protein O3P69_017363 [Scylla paramamosain]|uniref:Uncharacterized protein n=1 Tax=Scylla paramamosain TaxID=85552 RepID=A0AAW0SCA1_SCYPA
MGLGSLIRHSSRRPQVGNLDLPLHSHRGFRLKPRAPNSSHLLPYGRHLRSLLVHSRGSTSLSRELGFWVIFHTSIAEHSQHSCTHIHVSTHYTYTRTFEGNKHRGNTRGAHSKGSHLASLAN